MRNREIQVGTDSCVAVIVFSRVVVADDVTMLRTPGNAKSRRSGRILDLIVRKVKDKLRDRVIVVRESETGRDVQSFDGSVRDERLEPRCVFPMLEQGYHSMCKPRELWNDEWSWSQTESSICQSSLFCTKFGRLG